MDSPKNCFMSCIKDLEPWQLKRIASTIQNIKEPSVDFKSTKEKASFVFGNLCYIAETLTNGHDYNFNPVVGHLMAKMKIVHYNQTVCECVHFENDSDAEKVIERIEKISMKIFPGG